MGCLLLRRTTRALTPTDDGLVLYDHARRALEAAAEAEAAVGRRRRRPAGTLRLACSGVFGRLHVVPHLPAFRRRYPDIAIALQMSDGFADLVEEGIDLAIRIGAPGDSSLVARRIGTTRRAVVATPAYLARHGRPRHPTDLTRHDCIVYERLLTGATWNFVTPDGPCAVPVAGPVHVNGTEAARAAVLHGLGIGYLPVWQFVEGEIEDGRVVVVLADYEAPEQPINAVYPGRRHLAPKVRVAIDHFAAAYSRDPKVRIRPNAAARSGA